MKPRRTDSWQWDAATQRQQCTPLAICPFGSHVAWPLGWERERDAKHRKTRNMKQTAKEGKLPLKFRVDLTWAQQVEWKSNAHSKDLEVSRPRNIKTNVTVRKIEAGEQLQLQISVRFLENAFGTVDTVYSMATPHYKRSLSDNFVTGTSQECPAAHNTASGKTPKRLARPIPSYLRLKLGEACFKSLSSDANDLLFIRTRSDLTKTIVATEWF